MWTAKTLIRLGGCPGWYESSLGAHTFCLFCHVAAHFITRSCCSHSYLFVLFRHLWTTFFSIILVLLALKVLNTFEAYMSVYFHGTRKRKTATSFSCLIWAVSGEFGTYRVCEQRRFRRACASAQSRQNLRCSLIQAVSQEEPSDRKPDPWPLRMAGHAQLKFVMTECSKTQIRLTRPIFLLWNLEKTQQKTVILILISRV